MENFYSHAPCGARPAELVAMIQKMVISTHTPLAGRDFGQFRRHVAGVHFYSHAPCGARPYIDNVREGLVNFYSHAPCGARPTHHLGNVQQFTFLLTRPLRGATCVLGYFNTQIDFYSHAPCGARLAFNNPKLGMITDFYSHAPCGARQHRQKDSDSHS